MKQVVAIVKPFLAEQVIEAIAQLPTHEVIVREVKGFGRQKHYLESYRANEYSHAFVAKVEITVWVDEKACQSVVERIKTVSRTGRLGDGKILVLPVCGI